MKAGFMAFEQIFQMGTNFRTNVMWSGQVGGGWGWKESRQWGRVGVAGRWIKHTP